MPAQFVTCPGCSSPVPAGDRFCGTCGTPVTGSALLSNGGFDPWTELLQKLRQATVGEYEIRGELGRGGMAAVFLAQDLHLNRKVAVKVMLPGLAYTERMWDRFLAEARTAAKLDHSNIVYIHSVKEKERFLYFVMKYIDGRSLDDILAEHKPLPIPVAQTILVDVAKALDYAHREGVVHRDIKPANIMIDQKGNAVVMDFGIARSLDTQHFTQTGATIGTPAYMSPEQCHGSDTSASSDQYSLGVLAYEMLTGTPPFIGSPIELQIAHMQEMPRGIRELRPDLSLELSGAVMRMLAKDPAERWPSLHHLVPIFSRALELGDESPRNHLISMVRSGSVRSRSQSNTPVVPSDGEPVKRTPVDDYPSANEHVTEIVEASSGPHDAPTFITPSGEQRRIEANESPLAAFASALSESPSGPIGIGAPDLPIAANEPGAPAPTITPATGYRTLIVGAGAVAVLAIAGTIAVRSSKSRPTAEPSSAPLTAPVEAESPSATRPQIAPQTPFGESVATGHGPDAKALTKGKEPKTVAPDAVALLQLTFSRKALVLGDTARAKLEAFDDAGSRVTTPEITWVSSNPKAIRFLGPGQLVATGIGASTISVSAGSSSAKLTIEVTAKKR
jgi:serine/threonine protein kinase